MKCYKQVPVRGWAYMCFGIHELLGAHRTPAAREFLPLFVLVGTARHGMARHGWPGSPPIVPFPWRWVCPAAAQEAPDGTRGVSAFP